jgi:hypothetical protein
MVSNEEIGKRLKLIRNGQDPETGLEVLSKIQRPLEWSNNVCIIDYDSWPVKDLSYTVKDLFEDANYRLEEGTLVNGIYGRGHESLRLAIGYLAFRYRFKIEIYSDNGYTFLKISRAISNFSIICIDGLVYGNALYNDTFKGIVDVLKYLQPDYNGKLVCNKCGGYYKLEPGEFPDDFDKCQCGGKLKYYPLSEQHSKVPSKPNSLTNTIILLIPIITLLILFGIVLIFLYDPSTLYIFITSTIIATIFIVSYTVYYFIKAITKN